MAVTPTKPSFAANATKSAAMRAKTSSEKRTRSTLFTASTTWRMPSSDTMVAWRRVCGSTPFSASTTITASSQVDAPVAMLRVYCSCPGVSATMNLRFSVEKKR